MAYPGWHISEACRFGSSSSTQTVITLVILKDNSTGDPENLDLPKQFYRISELLAVFWQVILHPDILDEYGVVMVRPHLDQPGSSVPWIRTQEGVTTVAVVGTALVVGVVAVIIGLAFKYCRKHKR